MSAVLLFGCSVLLTSALSRYAPTPWLVPDLALISLVIGMTHWARRLDGPWLLASAMMGIMAPRHPLAVCLGYLLVGEGIAWVMKRWDSRARGVLLVLLAAGETLLVGWWWCVDRMTPTWAMLGWAMARVLITCAVGWAASSGRQRAFS